MFIRTDRLFLRPRWIEDAPELAAAIGHEAVVRMLAVVPWPYTLEHAREAVAREGNPHEPRFLITLPAEGGRIIGGCGFGRPPGAESGPVEVGYWVAPDAWGKGYATEAVSGMVTIAQTLGHRRIVGRHAADNPASGRVLRKAGFRPTGRTSSFHSVGRGADVEAVEYACDLGEDADPQIAPMRKAA